MKSTEFLEIKEVLFIILLGEASEQQLIYLLTALLDYSEITDKNNFGALDEVLIEKALDMLLKQEFDMFIEWYKQEIIKVENYELIIYLEL